MGDVKIIIDKYVTPEQRQVEREVEEILNRHWKKEISKHSANEKIDNLIKDARDKGIFSKRDIDGLLYRRDKDGTRSYVDFWKNIIRGQANEDALIKRWVPMLKEKNVIIEPFGSDIRGAVMIASFSKRKESPNLPDYKLIFSNGEIREVEAKNFKYSQDLKIGNLEIYAERDAHMIVGIPGDIILYPKNTIKFLLKIKRKGYKVGGKPCIRINRTGSNCDINLEQLKQQNKIQIYEDKGKNSDG